MSRLHSSRGFEQTRLWLLKKSFHGISLVKFVRRLLNLRSPQALKFTEITHLARFSTATPVNNSYFRFAFIRQ